MKRNIKLGMTIVKGFLCCFLFFFKGYSYAQQKVAFVVGNQDYKNESLRTLTNTINDAKLVKSTLESLGFRVELVQNVSLEGFGNALLGFKQRYPGPGIRVFYYAGHGMDFGKENYLVPIDASLAEYADIKDEGISFSNIYSNFLDSNATNIFLFDASKKAPLGKNNENSFGIKKYKLPKVVGTFTALANEKGEVSLEGEGNNGLFTTVLVNEIKRPNIELKLAFQHIKELVAEKSGNKQHIAIENRLIDNNVYINGNGSGALPASIASSKEVKYKVELSANDTFGIHVRFYGAGNYALGRVATVRAEGDSIIEFKNWTVNGIVVSEDETYNFLVSGDYKIQAVFVNRESEIVPETVFVEGGSFDMGNVDDGAEADEGPVHKVHVNSFYMGKYEVTQGQWNSLMGVNPSAHIGCPFCPVESVNWEEVQEYLTKLNERTHKHYRLPTEAEWEYAARGGNRAQGLAYAGSNDADSVAWYGTRSKNQTHTVGGLFPNELGIYDLSGNVVEWCSDWYEDYKKGSFTNPVGPETGEKRVMRGGSWCLDDGYCRVTFRDHFNPTSHRSDGGFRVVLSAN